MGDFFSTLGKLGSSEGVMIFLFFFPGDCSKNWEAEMKWNCLLNRGGKEMLVYPALSRAHDLWLVRVSKNMGWKTYCIYLYLFVARLSILFRVSVSFLYGGTQNNEVLLLHNPINVFPLNKHTHIAQSDRQRPKGIGQGCCSEYRCISQHLPVWLERWSVSHQSESVLLVLGHCKWNESKERSGCTASD